MSGSPRDDYLQRQVNAIAAMIARMLGLRTSGQIEEARLELERSYELLLGSQSEFIRRVDTGTASVLLGSPSRIEAYAQLVAEEAAQTQDESKRALLEGRAADLRKEASLRHEESP